MADTYALCAVVAMMKSREHYENEYGGYGHACMSLTWEKAAATMALECLEAHKRNTQ